MSFDAHRNFAISTVTTAPSPATSGTSLVLNSGDGALFPAAPFNAVIWPSGASPLSANAEIVRVTAIATDTLTITRAQESSSARIVVIGDQIMAAITAKTLTDAEATGVGVYGDGSDGTVTFDGSTTILTLAPASNIYTLTRDLYLASFTVNSSVTIKCAGFRLFWTGTLTNNGTIHNNGGNGTTGGGAQAGGGVGSIGNSRGDGGNTSTTVGGAATGQSQALGGNGGAGGLGSSGAGGTGATYTAAAAANSGIRSLPSAITGLPQQSTTPFRAGGGGGGGGGDGTANGGSGGGGGGPLILAGRLIAGTGAIQSRGGTGGNAAGTNCGGGGGGGGGYVVVVSSSVSAGAIAGQTIDAALGAGGTKTGTGVAGSNGTAGLVVLIAN